MIKNLLSITAIILLVAAVMYYKPANQEPVTLGYHEAPQWMKEEAKNVRR